MAWRGLTALGFGLILFGSLGGGCSGSDDPVGDDAGAISSGSSRPSGGGPKGDDSFDDDTPTSSSGGKKPSSSSGGRSDAGGDDDDAGESSSSGAPGCDDPNDAPDAEYDNIVPYTAGGDSVFIDGVLDGIDDIDEYAYDVTGASPSASLFLVDPVPAQLCVYGYCAEGSSLTVSCGDGQSQVYDGIGTDGNGMGCCGDPGDDSSQARVEGNLSCGQTPDSVYLYVDVRGQVDQCVDYRLRVGF